MDMTAPSKSANILPANMAIHAGASNDPTTHSS